MTNINPCPECRAGKHPNCDGTTWDDMRDEPTVCPCYSVDPPQHGRHLTVAPSD